MLPTRGYFGSGGPHVRDATENVCEELGDIDIHLRTFEIDRIHAAFVKYMNDICHDLDISISNPFMCCLSRNRTSCFRHTAIRWSAGDAINL